MYSNATTARRTLNNRFCVICALCFHTLLQKRWAECFMVLDDAYAMPGGPENEGLLSMGRWLR
jgi:hypothetical protein